MTPVDEIVKQATHLPRSEVRELIDRLENLLAARSLSSDTTAVEDRLLRAQPS